MIRIAHTVLTIVFLLSANVAFSAWNNPHDQQYLNDDANVLHSVFSSRPKHLDPARSYSSDEAIFTAQIYEPMVQYHYLKRPYILEPLTLTVLPEVIYKNERGTVLPSDAGADQIAMTEYVFTLRDDIRYQPHPALAKQDGEYLYHALVEEDLEDIYRLSDFKQKGTRNLIAEDYAYQIKRLADPKNHSPIATIMGNLILGFADLRDTLSEARSSTPYDFIDLRDYDIEGINVLNAHQFSITIKGKYPQFMYWLAMPFFAPMPWEAEKFYIQAGMQDKNLTLDWYPIGTGPYYLTENNPNKQMVLTRNPNYHLEMYPSEGEPNDQADGLLINAGKPLPFTDEIVFSLEKESIPMWNKFLQGYYDRSGVSSDAFDQAIQFGHDGRLEPSPDIAARDIQLSTTVQPSSFYWGFNMKDSIIGQPGGERARKLRQAIAMVFDLEEYIAIFMNGRGVVAQSPLPPGIFGHGEEKNPVVYYIETQQRKTVEDAKKLLSEAGYSNGIDQQTGQPLVLNMDVVASSGPDDNARLSWFRAQFKKLNIQLNIRATQYNRFQEKMRTGQAQIFSWGWNADYPDPENFLMLLYGPNGKVDHGGENAANYDNAEFNRLFEQMRNMEDSPERLLIINKMIEIVRHDSPWIWGFHPKSFTLSHNWIEPTKTHSMANNTLKYVKLDPKRRAESRDKWNEPELWPLFLIVLGLLALMAILIFAYWKREQRRITIIKPLD